MGGDVSKIEMQDVEIMSKVGDDIENGEKHGQCHIDHIERHIYGQTEGSAGYWMVPTQIGRAHV